MGTCRIREYPDICTFFLGQLFHSSTQEIHNIDTVGAGAGDNTVLLMLINGKPPGRMPQTVFFIIIIQVAQGHGYGQTGWVHTYLYNIVFSHKVEHSLNCAVFGFNDIDVTFTTHEKCIIDRVICYSQATRTFGVDNVFKLCIGPVEVDYAAEFVTQPVRQAQPFTVVRKCHIKKITRRTECSNNLKSCFSTNH